MNPVEIIPVKSKKEFNQFVKFPWEIYKNDPHWVPPLLKEVKALLDKNKNPFFKDAEMEMFLAKRDGEVVGRISAINNRLHNNLHNENIGFFGFFESVNDQEVANKLLDTAKDWIKNKGLDEMRGPASPSSNDEWGLLIEGFDDSPRLLMPYNPKYYMELMDNYGIKKIKDLLAFKIENEKLLKSEKLLRVSKIARKRSGIVIKQLDVKNFKGELEKVKTVYNQVWAPNWGFIPLSEAEIDAMAKNLKPIAEPSLVLFGEIEGKVIGFALVMLDYNQIFKEMNGKLFPFNFIKLFTKRKTIKWARIITLGLLPEYQKRGLDAVFYDEIVHRAAKLGIMHGEASWVLEDNEMMKRGADVMNGEVYKKYRVYNMSV